MKEKIVKDTLFYSSSTILSRFFGFIRSIIVARFLGPSLYGMWNALFIILEYSRYSSLGVLNAMNREIPFYRGKKEHEKVKNIRNMGFSAACIPSLIIGLALVLISIFIKGHVGPKWVAALRVVAVLVFARQLYDFFVLLLRSAHEFKLLSKIQLAFAILDLALIGLLVVRFGFYGFLWAIVLTYILIICYMFYRNHRRYKLKFYFDKKLLIRLAKIGVFITLIGVVVNLRTTVDRLMIVRFLGVTELGYFGISYVLIRFIFLIPSAISQIIYPRLVERYGSSNKNTNSMRNYVEISTKVLTHSMPLIIGEAFLFLPFGVRLLLPQYIPGIVAAQITVLGLFFFSAEIIAGDFLVTTNRLRWYLGCSLIAVIFNIVLDYIFLKAGFGIKGVAIGGIMITSFVYASFVLGTVIFQYLKNISGTILYLMKLYLPFFYSLCILLILNYSNLHIVNKMILYAVLCLPLLWKLEKETKAISFVFNTVNSNINIKK